MFPYYYYLFLRKSSHKNNNHSDEGNEEVENPMYDATEPHAKDQSHSNTSPTVETKNQSVVYYTSVKKVRWAMSEAGGNGNVKAETGINHGNNYEIVDEPAYDSTCGGINSPPVSNYDKVTNAFTNIDVDDYGYNVTTQRTGDRRNIHTDNVYNRLS